MLRSPSRVGSCQASKRRPGGCHVGPDAVKSSNAAKRPRLCLLVRGARPTAAVTTAIGAGGAVMAEF